jgi:lysosomal acid lipase/cholesteryl ester hydrolase
LLAVQRIDAVMPPVATAKGPAFLYHGIMEGGERWVMNPGQESLAFTLASAGYQVWIGNTRSSKYTFGHISFQRQDKASSSVPQSLFLSLQNLPSKNGSGSSQ